METGDIGGASWNSANGCQNSGQNSGDTFGATNTLDNSGYPREPWQQQQPQQQLRQRTPSQHPSVFSPHQSPQHESQQAARMSAASHQQQDQRRQAHSQQSSAFSQPQPHQPQHASQMSAASQQPQPQQQHFQQQQQQHLLNGLVSLLKPAGTPPEILGQLHNLVQSALMPMTPTGASSLPMGTGAGSGAHGAALLPTSTTGELIFALCCRILTRKQSHNNFSSTFLVFFLRVPACLHTLAVHGVSVPCRILPRHIILCGCVCCGTAVMKAINDDENVLVQQTLPSSHS